MKEGVRHLDDLSSWGLWRSGPHISKASAPRPLPEAFCKHNGEDPSLGPSDEGNLQLQRRSTQKHPESKGSKAAGKSRCSANTRTCYNISASTARCHRTHTPKHTRSRRSNTDVSRRLSSTASHAEALRVQTHVRSRGHDVARHSRPPRTRTLRPEGRHCAALHSQQEEKQKEEMPER